MRHGHEPWAGHRRRRRGRGVRAARLVGRTLARPPSHASQAELLVGHRAACGAGRRGRRLWRGRCRRRGDGGHGDRGRGGPGARRGLPAPMAARPSAGAGNGRRLQAHGDTHFGAGRPQRGGGDRAAPALAHSLHGLSGACGDRAGLARPGEACRRHRGLAPRAAGRGVGRKPAATDRRRTRTPSRRLPPTRLWGPAHRRPRTRSRPRGRSGAAAGARRARSPLRPPPRVGDRPTERPSRSPLHGW